MGQDTGEVRGKELREQGGGGQAALGDLRAGLHYRDRLDQVHQSDAGHTRHLEGNPGVHQIQNLGGHPKPEHLLCTEHPEVENVKTNKGRRHFPV